VPSQRVTTDMQAVKDALIDAKASTSIGGLTRWELCLATGLDYRAVYDRLQRIRRQWQVNDASPIAVKRIGWDHYYVWSAAAEACSTTQDSYVHDALQHVLSAQRINDARIARDGEDLETMLYRALFSSFVSAYAEARKAMAKARELLAP
jgi:hypothetical protein